MHADHAAEGPEPRTVDVAVRRAEPDAHVVAVLGDVDAAGVGAVRAGVDEALGAGARTVVLDLTGVVLLASAGMTLLLEVDADLRTRGCALLLVADAVRAVRRPLAITGLDRVLTLHDDVAGALAAAGADGHG